MSKVGNVLIIAVVGLGVFYRTTTEETRCPDDEGSMLYNLLTPVASDCDGTTTETAETKTAPKPASDDASNQGGDTEGATRSCDQTAAEKRWLEAQSAGVVSGGSMQDGIPTIHIEEAVWREINDTTRVGMASIFDCMVAGPEVVIPKINFATPAGRVLGSFDGIRKRIEMSN
ncbi:MAG: hypothetical protein LC676_08050 [Loktanella sp.]|nr:hypothetical protein [Loktanella sp.]